MINVWVFESGQKRRLKRWINVRSKDTCCITWRIRICFITDRWRKTQWHWWYMNKWTTTRCGYMCKYLLGKMSVSMFTQTNTWKCRLDYYPTPQEEKIQVKRRKNTLQHRGNICLSTAKSKANVGAVINVKTYGWRCSFPNWHWYQGATSDTLRMSMPASI